MRKPYRNQKEDINNELAPKGGRNGMGSRDDFLFLVVQTTLRLQV